MNFKLEPGFVQEHSDGEFDGKPRKVPFAAGTKQQFEALCLPACSVVAFTDTNKGQLCGYIGIAFDHETGLYATLRANNLRSFAASLIAMADSLDGGKGKQ